MTSHANCPHPATKSARAACRDAYRPAPARNLELKASAQAILREVAKASRADSRTLLLDPLAY